MRVVRVRAGSVKEALDRLKRELGSDAVVVSTRTVWERDGVKKRRRIEVAAAVEREAASGFASDAPQQSAEIQEGLHSEIINLSAVVGQLKDSWDRANVQVFPELRDRVERLEGDMSKLYDSFHDLACSLERVVDEMFPMPIKRNKRSEDVLKKVYARLWEGGFHPSLCRRWLKELAEDLNGSDVSDPKGAESKALELIARKLIEFVPPCEPSRVQGFKQLAFIGPSGTGKTTTLAKLIVDWADRGARPAVAFIERENSVALDSLLSPFGLSATPVQSWEDVKRWALDKEVPAILDLCGTSPRERAGVERLGSLCSSLNLDVHLCLPASLSLSDTRWLVSQFERFEPKSIVLTKLDECKSPAGVLQGLSGCNIPLSIFTTGREIPSDFEAATPERLAAMILGLV